MGRAGSAGACLSRPDRRMPGVGRRKLGMAVRRLLHGKSAFWGGAIGRNPTDRGKAGSKKSGLVDGAGGPLSVVVAGANVHDTKLLRPTLQNMVVTRPADAQNLCLDQGYDNPTGHGTVAAFQYWGHIRRIGEEKLDQWGQKTCPARRWVLGTHPGLAVQVPGDTGALRQEAGQLLGPASASMCPHLVPPSTPSRCFEIVSKFEGRREIRKFDVGKPTNRI